MPGEECQHDRGEGGDQGQPVLGLQMEQVARSNAEREFNEGDRDARSSTEMMLLQAELSLRELRKVQRRPT